MKKHYTILKGTALATVLTFFTPALQAQSNFGEKAPQTLKERLLKQKQVKKTTATVKKSMSRGNHITPSEIINLEWNGTDWDTISKDIIKYKTGTHLKTETIVKDYTGNNTFTSNSRRNTWTYDASENQTSITREYWNSSGNNWEPFEKNIYEYDLRDNMTLNVDMNWNSTASQWDTTYGERSTYTYNANDDIVTETVESYNNTSGTWEFTDKEIRAYDSNDFWISHLFQRYNGTAWENDYKEEYIVNGSGEWTEADFYNWDGASWEIGDKVTDITWYDFDDIKLTGYIYKEFNGATHDNSIKLTGTYHTNGEPLMQSIEIWNGAAWENNEKTTITYDFNDNLTEAAFWSGSGSTWILSDGERINYTYDTDNNIEIIEEEIYDDFSVSWENSVKYFYLYLDSVASAGPDVSTCMGDSVQLNASGGADYSWSPATGLSCTDCPNPKASPGTDKEYVVIITNGTDSGTDTMTVTVNALPVVTMSGPDTFYCATDPGVVLSGSPAGGTYTGAGVTGNEFNPSLAGEGNHTITYTYTDGNNCSNSYSRDVTVDICAGIKTTSLLTDLSLYPNPGNGVFILELYQAQQEDLVIHISNTLGQKVFSKSFKQHAGPLKEEINLEKFQAGIYLLSIQAGREGVNKKIVKK